MTYDPSRFQKKPITSASFSSVQHNLPILPMAVGGHQPHVILHPHSAEHGPSAARFGERRRVRGAHGAAASDGGADGADGGGRGTAEGSAGAVAGGTGGTAGVGRWG